MTDKEAMKLALFALDIVKIHYTQSRHINEAIAALKERLADSMREGQRLGQEIEQKIGCVNHDCDQCKEQRKPLNWEPIQEFWRNNSNINWDELESAIKQAAHGIKGNT